MKIQNISASLIAAFIFVGCTGATEDLEKSSPLEIEAQTEEVSAGSVESGPDSKLAKVPKVVGVGKAPVGSSADLGPAAEIKKADLKDVEQVISLSSPEYRPTLDLLFVMDDSYSMEPHQDRLNNNINLFVDELSKLNILDFQIGVTTTYDSRRYFKDERLTFEENRSRVTEWKRLQSTPGLTQRNFERLGRLLPLKDKHGNVANLKRRFLKTGDSVELLKATLKVGAKEHQEFDQHEVRYDGSPIIPKPPGPNADIDEQQAYLSRLTEVLVVEAYGPRYEELFGPMMAALDLGSLVTGPNADYYRRQFPETNPLDDHDWNPPGINVSEAEKTKIWQKYAASYNPGFVRKNAHLGVIFVTDTLDQSFHVNGKKAGEFLQRLKGGDANFERISAFGVLHKNTMSPEIRKKYKDEWGVRHCVGKNAKILVDDDVRGPKNWAKEAKQLELFLHKTNNYLDKGQNILNLCPAKKKNNYGQKLIQVAQRLFKRAAGVGYYDLEMIPSGEITVFSRDGKNEDAVDDCNKSSKGQLCWKKRISKGERKIVIHNQEKLYDRELVIRYKGIDPLSATKLNSKTGL